MCTQPQDTVDSKTLADNLSFASCFVYRAAACTLLHKMSRVLAAATALESEALKIPTGVPATCMGPQLLKMLLAANGLPASVASASTTAGDISATATDESATAADKSTAAAVECKSTTMGELRECLLAACLSGLIPPLAAMGS